MNATTKVTREQAEAVLAAIESQFSSYLMNDSVPSEMNRPISDEDRPQIVEDYMDVDFAIVWESGSPYEWAFRAGEGGLDEELSSLAEDFGGALVYTSRVEMPTDVHCEPIESFSLGIYPL
jgi:hypothetical protein